MVQSLEAIKGGGGSIRVGTTGTISSLMTREMNSMILPSHHHKPLSSSSSRATPRKSSSEIEPSSSNSCCSSSSSITISNNIGNGNFTSQQDFGAKKAKGSSSYPNKGKSNNNTTHRNDRIPMLGSDSISLNTTPIRDKADHHHRHKKVPTNIINIVEVVDIKCGTSASDHSSANRAWTVPITSRLRKLGFSKLSQTIV